MTTCYDTLGRLYFVRFFVLICLRICSKNFITFTPDECSDGSQILTRRCSVRDASKRRFCDDNSTHDDDDSDDDISSGSGDDPNYEQSVDSSTSDDSQNRQKLVKNLTTLIKLERFHSLYFMT